MKQRVLLILTTLLLCMGAKGQTVALIDGLKYNIYTEDSYATLMPNNYKEENIVIPGSVTYGGKNYPVTKIEDKCFSECERLKSVIVPYSVTELGDSCFYRCYNLTNIPIQSVKKNRESLLRLLF